ncbi:DUF7832 domain-containing protein [Pseudomonas sp. KNUC1026]|uniref:DUF7832 domain-containing protein n=1 Tax=Pseudomonas sp. KNUC1026 TaxID=2893890 RepID=UPI001F3DF9C2|nr:hypothetical protein [Pseudomonas sp. KNUC1026]UFH51287.1 hypothetical protein LN139_09845 [Pseudomonas sp. KNUC1026]
MKYDDASWHYGGTFPAELPEAAGATHIGMFLAWMLMNDLASEELEEDAESELAQLKDRTLTGARFLMTVLDEKLTDEEFSETGNAFAVAYYQGLNNDSRYVDDYLLTFGASIEGLYHVEDSWAHYDQLSGVIGARFGAWQAAGQPEYIV